jgi:DNA (cytosine-5)-methyltransferase 1
MVRTIRVVRPKYVLVENVAALLGRGMGTVLGDLAEGGYDAEWDCIPAAAVGAPHFRNRVWIIAHTQRKRSAAGTQSQGGKENLPHSLGECAFGERRRDELESWARGHRWGADKPGLGRVDNGVPHRVDRLRALGNSIVPQVAEFILRGIKEVSA